MDTAAEDTAVGEDGEAGTVGEDTGADEMVGVVGVDEAMVVGAWDTGVEM